MPESTNFAQRRVDTLIRAEVARDDVCGLGRRMRRPFAVEAHPRVAFSNAIKERAADQPTAAGKINVPNPVSIVEVVSIPPPLRSLVAYRPDRYEAANDSSLISVYGCLSLTHACAQPEVFFDFSYDSDGSEEAIHGGF